MENTDLLRQVLQAWTEQAPAQLTQRLAQARCDPRKPLHDVISLPFRGRAGARIELAIRAWARRDPNAQQALHAADAARLVSQRQIFQALGFAAEEARSRNEKRPLGAFLLSIVLRSALGGSQPICRLACRACKLKLSR